MDGGRGAKVEYDVADSGASVEKLGSGEVTEVSPPTTPPTLLAPINWLAKQHKTNLLMKRGNMD